MDDVNAKVKAVLNGEIRIRRFNAEEQGGSSEPADGFLWRCILQAESELAEIERGGVCPRNKSSSLRTIPPCRYLRDVSQDLPLAFEYLLLELGTYQDRGRESIVCDSGDGYVRKLRPMRPSILSGYMAPLAADEDGEHLRFYNADYYISDLQPGRNTVIDSDTGMVRFIDPRITLNDPQGPRTHVAKYGKRCEAMPGQTWI